jgi:hypothetical protein
MQRKLLGTVSVDFDATGSTTDHILHIRQILEKCISYTKTSRKSMIQLGGGIV